MSCSIEEQKLAVLAGYNLLMRYHPATKTLFFDSQKPDFNRYEEFLDHEVRYHALKLKDEQLAKVLLEQNKKEAWERYQYYLGLTKGS